MSDNLPSSYDPHATEPKWSRFWKDHDFFTANTHSHRPPFCVILPPPNVTGKLHMGHALDDTLQDILVRLERMRGHEVLWLPGFDHAGISTQTVVEKHLIQTEGKRRKDYSREQFLKHIWSWKERHENTIIEQLNKLGCSLDWSRKRFTLDEKASLSVKTAFKMLYDEGLIYRGDYLVNWDPITQTALADDEVEYEEKEGYLWFFSYPIDGTNRSIEIATTRPETMLGDTAIAVNPHDKRYKDLIGQTITLPLTNRQIPIIADDYVDREFGTGCVKITPAHDFNDYEIGLRHHLPMINILTPDGKINEVGKDLAGLPAAEARSEVVKRMKALNLLVKHEAHTHRVGHSYRSKAVIEPYLSKQWFVKMSAFKKELKELVTSGQIQLLPEHYHKTYFHWIDHLRDWCISRQLWWGHRIPIWYHVKDPNRLICHVGESPPEEVTRCPDEWVQDPDVLDTWFSSALWPFSTLGWPNQTPDLERFFPTSILITGHDILFFWVARMILMSHITLKTIPFHKTFIHGLIFGKSYWRRDEDGHIQYVKEKERLQYELGKPLPKDVESKWEKMSKSKGNIIDPIEIIDSYGADAMRMALCSSVTDSRQIDLDRRRFEEFKNFSNKLWNAARFILMNIESLTPEQLAIGISRSDLTLEDEWILSLLNRTILKVHECLEQFDFDHLASSIYTFFWDQFCAYYLELCKPYLSQQKNHQALRTNKQIILLTILVATIRMLHPITPFITEEIFSHLKNRFTHLKPIENEPYSLSVITALEAKACCVAPYPEMIKPHDIDTTVEGNFQVLMEIIYQVRNVRGEMKIPHQEKVDLFVIGDNTCTSFDLIEENTQLIGTLAKVKHFEFLQDTPQIAYSATAMVGQIKLLIPLPEQLIQEEKKRLVKEKEKLTKQIESLKLKLDNPQFMSRAPKALVDQTKENLFVLQAKLKEIKLKLE